MRVKTLIDAKIEIDPPSIPWYVSRKGVDEQAKYLAKWCKDFEAFVRDHRSQDPVGLSVIRVFQDQCSHCGCEWGVDEAGFPGCCQKAIEEHETAIAQKAG